MIWYIAGKITGDKNYTKKFMDAAVRLNMSDEKNVVLNPAMLPCNIPSEKAMSICMKMLEQADSVYALKDWVQSDGAGIEVAYARYLGKEIIFEEEI